MAAIDRVVSAQVRYEPADRADFATDCFRALFAGALLFAGAVVFGFGGLWGSLLFSPLTPSVGALAIIRIFGIGLFSTGAALWPTCRRARALEGLVLYSGVSLFYVSALALTSGALERSWPEAWIVSLAALHAAILLATAPAWLRGRKRRRRR